MRAALHKNITCKISNMKHNQKMHICTASHLQDIQRLLKACWQGMNKV